MEPTTRINKYLAERGYATRKGADELIQKGKVFVNGRRAVIGEMISDKDKVEIKHRAKDTTTTGAKYVYYAYNKPVGISTNPENTVIKGVAKVRDILEVCKFPTKVFPIGRLDKDSTGLLIMTNDGRVTDKLLSPKYVHEKEYVVKTEKEFTDRFLENMAQGVRFDRYKSEPCEIWRIRKNVFHIILTEGKKRQIRRMCEALYHKVIDLRRIRIMNIHLEKLKPNEYREITGEELKKFLKSLKIS